jgi:hypothetical protein
MSPNWDGLRDVVTAYVSDVAPPGGDSPRAIVLAAIERVRAALERPRPAPPEPTFADNRGIVGALQDLQGTGAPPKRDYKLFLASGEALYGSKQAVQEAHWAIWRAEPTTTCTGQTYRDFAERCDRARQEAEQRAADATKLANELAGGTAGTGAAPPDSLIQAAEEAANVLARLATRVKWGGISNVSRSEEDHWRKLADDIRELIRGGAAQPPPSAPETRK